MNEKKESIFAVIWTVVWGILFFHFATLTLPKRMQALPLVAISGVMFIIGLFMLFTELFHYIESLLTEQYENRR